MKAACEITLSCVYSKKFVRVPQQSNLECKIKKNFKSEPERTKLRAPYG